MSKKYHLALLLALALPLAAQEKPKIETKTELAAEPLNSFSLDYEYEHYQQNALDPWRLYTAELSHKFGFGSVIARVNRAHRFATYGTQYEVDAYPHIMPGMYAYLNAGWSRDSIFPNHRYGGEVFKTLGHAFEGSIGFRRLLFSSTNVTLYTGSIAKYRGNYYYVLRPYVSHDNTGTSWSGQVQLRRYYESADTYWGIRGGYGKSPTEDIILQEINRLRSWNVAVFGKKKLTKNWVFDARAGWRDQEFRANSHRRSYYVGSGLEWRF